MELKLAQPTCFTDERTGRGTSNSEHFGMEMRTVLHPKGITHRAGKAVLNKDGRRIGFTGEVCRKVRHSNVSSRSKNAKVSASGKAQRFVKTQRDIDAKLDYQPSLEVFVPRKLELRKATRTLSR